MIPNKLLSHRKLLTGTLIAIFCCAGTNVMHGQQKTGTDATDQLGISAGGGYTFAHTDFRHTTSMPSPVWEIGAHYYSLRFLEISLDFQLGVLKGGSSQFVAESTKTGFKNNYWGSCLSFRFFPAGLVENNDHDNILQVLSMIYVGTGLGYMKSNTTANPIPLPEYGAMVTYKGSDFFVPLEIGLNLPVAKLNKNLLLLNLNFRTSLCLSDEIDGYVPTVEANKFNDAFSTLTAGVIYKFGL